MTTTTFTPSSVTIQKGSSITLIDDAPVPHIIQNGTWASGAAQPHQEAGAPTVNAHFSGNDRQVIGPFPVAGTYHLYCAVHQGMNLTVVVQG
jgi:plastocyanin